MMHLSDLDKTWIFDLDGTLVEHDGCFKGGERLLPGVKELFARMGSGDKVVLLSARPESQKAESLAFLAAEGLRIDFAIFGLPYGERILFNDEKPSGLKTAIAVSLKRDGGVDPDIRYDLKSRPTDWD